jgi:AraC-like DNA-binding protein
VALESGFANERTFFRVFKEATGMSPKEWAAQQKPMD